MAHFAQLDKNNIVLKVVVVSNDVIRNTNLPESEILGIEFLRGVFTETVWKQTSYNNNFRGNYAGIGFKYYPEQDMFMPPSPYPSWVINTTTAKWEAPVPKPDCKKYEWNEETLSWDYVAPKPQPFPSWTLDACDVWQPPIPRPTDPLPEKTIYVWKESILNWESVPLPDLPTK